MTYSIGEKVFIGKNRNEAIILNLQGKALNTIEVKYLYGSKKDKIKNVWVSQINMVQSQINHIHKLDSIRVEVY